LVRNQLQKKATRRSQQFGTVEVTSLEKKQWQIEHLRLTWFEFKLFPAFRDRATGAKLFVARSSLGWLSDDNPGPTLRTGNARARNAIGHN